MAERKWVKDERCMYIRIPTRGHTAGKTVYCAQVWVPGRRRFSHFTLGTSITAARKLRDKIVAEPEKYIAEREAAKRKSETVGYTVQMLYRDFTKNYRGRGGTDYYIGVIKGFVEFCGSGQADTVTANDIDGYLRKRRSEVTKGKPRVIDGKTALVGAGQQLVGNSTLRKHCIAIAKMFKWGRVRGKTTARPFEEYEKPQEPDGPQARALTAEEEQRLLDLLPPFEHDVVEWLIYTGMDRGDIRKLTWGQIANKAGKVKYIRGKTGKSVVFPLSLTKRIPAILARHPQRT